MTEPKPAPESDPDWNLLPNQPEKFFGLSAGWSETDLKSAYGKLIRRFKPDRSPDEFQKIRRAYETLRDISQLGNRYAEALQMSFPVDGVENDPGSDLWPTDRWNILSPREPITLGIDPSAPLESFQKIFHKVVKSADDYLDLAILSDLIDDPQMGAGTFVDWLWQGLAKYPRSTLLAETLAAHYSDLTNESLEFEPAVDRLRHLDHYFSSSQLILAIIFGLARTKGIKQALAIWEEIYKPIAVSHTELIKVLVDLLPAAALHFEDEWVREQIGLLESDNNWQVVAFESLEYIISIVNQVRQIPDETLENAPLIKQLRRVCYQVLMLPPHTRREFLLQTIDDICSRRETLLKTPVCFQPLGLKVVELWEYLLATSDIIRPPGGIEAGQVINLRKNLLVIGQTTSFRLWAFARVSSIIAATLCIILSVILTVVLLFVLIGNIGIPAIVLAIIFAYIKRTTLERKLNNELWTSIDKFIKPLLCRSYRPLRPQLLKLLEVQSISVRALSYLLSVSHTPDRLADVKRPLRDAMLSDCDLHALIVTARAR